MGYRVRLLCGGLFYAGALGYGHAAGGMITFHGAIVEAGCGVQTDKATPTLTSCSRQVATSALVTTEIIKPEAHMLVWRANETSKKDVPVTQWKMIQVIYW